MMLHDCRQLVHIEPPWNWPDKQSQLPEEDSFQQNHMAGGSICPIEYIINERSLDEV